MFNKSLFLLSYITHFLSIIIINLRKKSNIPTFMFVKLSKVFYIFFYHMISFQA